MTRIPKEGGRTPIQAHVFVQDVAAPDLDDEDRHHLARVLRVRDGDAITVADGRGRWRPCRFGPVLEPDGEIVTDPAPDPAVGVAFALVKGDRPEWTVQKLTELGLELIVPFVAERSVVRWDPEREAKRVTRLRRVAREAAMQSRRSRLPIVEPVRTFAAVAARPGAVRADFGGRAIAPGDVLVLVGPEGGWSTDERAVGLPAITLGPTVLRAETAAVTAGVLVTALRPGGALTPQDA